MAELNDKIINFKDLSRFKTRYDEKIENENKILKANIKALEYVVNNSNRLNYTGQVITNSNSVTGDIKNVIINGNTRYKKSDGTYTDTWESGISLESVGENEKDSNGKYVITIKSIDNSKNLIEKSNIITGYYYDENNTFKPNSNMNTLKKLINVKSGATYYIKNSSNTSPNVSYILYFTETNTLIKCEYNKNIVTIPDNCAKIRFSGSDLNKLCFSLNNFYSEYEENKRTILLEKPLMKTQGITDVLDLEKMTLTRNCGYEKYVGNDSENWSIQNDEKTNIITFICLFTINGKDDVDNIVNMSSPFKPQTYGTTYLDNTNESISTTLTKVRVNILKSKLTTQDVAGFKTWLASNPITVVYQLATPTTEIIEILPTDNPLQSYNDSTTLTLNNTIKNNISADIPTNVNAIIVNQANSIKTLTDSLLETQALLIDNTITEI